MPELPEVETVVRTLRPHILHATIQQMEVLHPKSLQAPDESALQALLGSCITHVTRRGKLILLQLQSPQHSTPLFMAFHLKMTGSFFVHPSQTQALRHTRLIFDITCQNTSTSRLFFDDIRTFGYARIMWEPQLTQWPFFQNLGPEPLELSPHAIALLLTKHNSSIKSTLLNQTVLAGIGNIYADEALFRAGIHPEAKGASLPMHRLESLGAAIIDVLTQSIEECGSSIKNYSDANGNAGAFQNFFFVYGKKQHPCLVCGNPLESAKVAGRSTVYCATCQLL